jgi:hypothetical protein
MTAPKLPYLRLPADDPRGGLVRAVLASPRLLAALPADELDTLCTAHASAEAAVKAAQALPAVEDNLEAELDKAHRAGKPTDPAKLITRLGAAQAAKANRDAAVQLLSQFPHRFAQEIISLITDHTEDFYAVLQQDLDDILDQAEAAVAELNGAESADAAIDAGAADAWSSLRAQTRAYHDVRLLQATLLRSENNLGHFAPGAPGLAAAYFGGIREVYPNYVTEATRGARDLLGGTVVTAPFDLFATDSPAHLLAIVKLRGRLNPWVASADEAMDAHAAVRIAQPAVVYAPREAGRLTAGSQAFNDGVRRARLESATRDADERADLASGMR